MLGSISCVNHLHAGIMSLRWHAMLIPCLRNITFSA